MFRIFANLLSIKWRPSFLRFDAHQLLPLSACQLATNRDGKAVSRAIRALLRCVVELLQIIKLKGFTICHGTFRLISSNLLKYQKHAKSGFSAFFLGGGRGVTKVLTRNAGSNFPAV